MEDFGIVYQRPDGSFVINKDGNPKLPYHVPNHGEFAGLYAKVKAYADANPEMVKPEEHPEPDPITPPKYTYDEKDEFLTGLMEGVGMVSGNNEE